MDAIYKFWYRKRQRKLWEAAAETTHDGDLARWVRYALDENAARTLDMPVKSSPSPQ